MSCLRCFQLFGLGLLAIGVWLKVDKEVANLAEAIKIGLEDSLIDIAAWVFIGAGLSLSIICGSLTNFLFFGACISHIIYILRYIHVRMSHMNTEFVRIVSVDAFTSIMLMKVVSTDTILTNSVNCSIP